MKAACKGRLVHQASGECTVNGETCCSVWPSNTTGKLWLCKEKGPCPTGSARPHEGAAPIICPVNANMIVKSKCKAAKRQRNHSTWHLMSHLVQPVLNIATSKTELIGHEHWHGELYLLTWQQVKKQMHAETWVS